MKSKAKTIESLDDLQDLRSRNIVAQYKLPLNEILPRYNKLEEEVRAAGGEIEFDFADESQPLDKASTMIKGLASGAVISYELTHGEEVAFPMPPQTIAGIEDKYLRTVMFQMRGVIKRTAPVATYEQIGGTYEALMQQVSECFADYATSL